MYADDTAIMVHIKDNKEVHRCPGRNFVVWRQAINTNGLELNTSKTKELAIDWRRDRGSPRSVLQIRAPYFPYLTGKTMEISEACLSF